MQDQHWNHIVHYITLYVRITLAILVYGGSSAPKCEMDLQLNAMHAYEHHEHSYYACCTPWYLS